MFIPVWLIVVVLVFIFLFGVFCGGYMILYQQRLEEWEDARLDNAASRTPCPNCRRKVVQPEDNFCMRCGKSVRTATA
jgi:DNA-directed RNA polymerase subunit RPC12/RpoP